MHSPAPPVLSRTSRIVGLVVVFISLAGLIAGVGSRFSREAQAAQARAAGLRERRESANLPPEVPITSPEPHQYMPYFSITGTLDPIQEANLGFNAAGRLATIEVRLGDHVEAGQLIATLDRRSIAAQSAVVSAAVEAGNAQLAMAQDRLRRTEALHQRGAASEADLEGARQQLALATAQLGQAQAQGRVVSSDGSNHLLRAPFAGTITRVPDGVGNVVMPGQQLFRIEDMSRLVMHTGISERALSRIAVDDTVTLDLVPNVTGRLRAFVRSLDPVTRRAAVEIEFPNEQGTLIGHQLMKGQIHCDRPIPVMRVPSTALRSDSTILVVDGQNRVQPRPVQAMVEADGSAMVLFGLTPNDRVVVRPTADLEPGDVVRPATGAPARR